MKTKLLTALIIDKNPAQAKQMAALIKDLFSQVYVEAETEPAIRECRHIKPGVVFFNLGINQRTANFELLEKLPLGEERSVIVFGYNEGHEPELVAHAMEIGFQDIFTRPFDSDIIASKVNLWFKFDKSLDHDLSYTKLHQPLRAQLSLNMRLVSVDENGMSFQSPHYLSKGTVLKLAHPIMEEIFAQSSMDMMVTKTWLSEDWKSHYLFIEPKKASEQTSSALRSFILRKI